MWSEDRRAELVELEQLLMDAESLNSGSGAIERMQRLVEIAKKLKRSDARLAKPSFMQFLLREALQPNA